MSVLSQQPKPPQHASGERVSVTGGLPTRITGIVFWGMVLAGFLIALVTIQAWEADLKNMQSAFLAEAALTLQTQLDARPDLRPGRSAKPPVALDEMRAMVRSPRAGS